MLYLTIYSTGLGATTNLCVDMAKDIEISVIIPALNEEKYISHAISGLKAQSFRKFETIVVDGGSKDRTRELARKNARVIMEHGRGAAGARNEGARNAKGGILLFLDADTKPTPNLLRTYHNAFEDSRIIAATGPILPLEKAKRRVLWGYKFVSIWFVRASMAVGRPSFIGSNFAIRKDAFWKAKGFDKSMMTYEDWDLSNRLKKHGRMRYLNKAVVYTSIRRINKWGVSGFFFYYLGNIFSYHVHKKPKSDYSPIR